MHVIFNYKLVYFGWREFLAFGMIVFCHVCCGKQRYFYYFVELSLK